MNRPRIKTAANPNPRQPGSGTGAGGGQARRLAQTSVTCSGNCGGKCNPTGHGTASMWIRRAKPIWLCPDCTTAALEAVGITVEYPAPTPTETQPAVPAADGGVTP